ncbi:MAG: hypothetical protein AAF352_06550 [Pseudomonadota bacterium]
MQTIEHDDVVAIERELMWHDGKWSHVLIVYTPLVVDAFHENYDVTRLNQFISEISQILTESQMGFHTIIVRHRSTA